MQHPNPPTLPAPDATGTYFAHGWAIQQTGAGDWHAVLPGPDGEHLDDEYLPTLPRALRHAARNARLVHPNPPTLPVGAIGFLATRHDKPERRAVYLANGHLANTFGQGEPIAHLEGYLAAGGFRLGKMLEAPSSPYTGGVWEVLR